MTGLRVTNLAVANVGVLRGRIDLGAFDPEITLITGANETGKTTTVNALRCALFERHDAKHAGIRALQPHQTRLDPEIWVDFELDGHSYTLHKRFLNKPLSELSIDDGTPFVGAEADEQIRTCLGAQTPGNRGAKREDMGVWGLLWVSQDEAAFSDPGQDLGDDTRGALHDAIGRQVGQIVGGRHGEHLRSRVLKEAERYWTATWRETNELAAAMKLAQEAEEKVRDIQAAIDQVEDQAERLASLQGMLAETLRERPGLEADLKRAEADAQQVKSLEAEAKNARARLGEAQARHSAAKQRRDARNVLIADVERLQQRVQENTAAAAEMAKILTGRQQAHEDVQDKKTKCVAAVEEAKHHRDAVDRALEAARCRVQSRELRHRFSQARDRAAQVEALIAEREQALDRHKYVELANLDQARNECARRLDSVGTVLTIDGIESGFREAFGRERTVDIPNVGLVHVVPSTAGVNAARERLLNAENTLSERLRSASVESVRTAQEQRNAREALETEAAACSEDLTRQAPEGIEALAGNVAAGSEMLVQATQKLAMAEKRTGELVRLRQELAKLTIDDACLGKLRDLEKTLTLAKARQDALGTRIEIQPRQSLALRVDNDTPTEISEEHPFERTVSTHTTLEIGDIATVSITPGTGDVKEVAAELSRTETAFESALRDSGVNDMSSAEAQARKWMETRAGIRDAENALQELVPDGLDTLRETVRSCREKQDLAEKRLAAARARNAHFRQLQEEMELHPVTADIMDRIQEGDVALADARREVATLAAKVRFGDGEPHIVWAPASGELPGGIRWQLIPGEGGTEEDAALERLTREFDQALKDAGLVSLDQARERALAWDTLGTRIDATRERLADIAPEGLDALEQAVAALGEKDAEDTDSPDDLDALTVEQEEARKKLEEAEQVLREAESQAARKATELASFEGEFRAKEGEYKRTEDDSATATERLVGERREVDDNALEERLANAEDALSKAVTAAEKAEQAVEEVAPDLLIGDADRARAALEANRGEEARLNRDIAGVQALLDRAAAEGRFEELGEAEAELAEAEDALARTERAAAAAKCLATAVNDAYTSAQERFLAPVVREARPYLQTIRPGTEIRMSHNLAVDKVVRRGTEEGFDALSGGTREQLSVIVRIALARVLARDEKSAPLPLILDDTMGWTDDDRFLSMVRILRNAAKEFQIIVLTCHPARFQRLQPGRTIRLDDLRAERLSQNSTR